MSDEMLAKIRKLLDELRGLVPLLPDKRCLVERMGKRASQELLNVASVMRGELEDSVSLAAGDVVARWARLFQCLQHIESCSDQHVKEALVERLSTDVLFRPGLVAPAVVPIYLGMKVRATSRVDGTVIEGEVLQARKLDELRVHVSGAGWLHAESYTWEVAP